MKHHVILMSTISFATAQTCSDNASFRFIRNNGQETSCGWLTERPDREQIRKNRYCHLGHVRGGCQYTCSFCPCEDDSNYEFPMIVNPDNSQPCSWITKNPDKVEIRRNNYCYENGDPTIANIDVGSNCVEACGFCLNGVVVTPPPTPSPTVVNTSAPTGNQPVPAPSRPPSPMPSPFPTLR